MEAKALACPNCGVNISFDQTVCEYCGSKIYLQREKVSKYKDSEIERLINSYKSLLQYDNNNVEANFSIAVLRIQTGMYDDAIRFLRRIADTNFNDSEALFYLAIASLKGKKPFLVLRKEIDQIEGYLNTALSINEKAIYYYLLGLIRYDHHFRKGYRVSPDYKGYISMAKANGLDINEVNSLHEILKVVIPDEIKSII